MEGLADRFAPLANRKYKRRPQSIILEDCINNSLQLNRPDLKAKEIKYRVPNSKTAVSVDPAELDIILINLISNASYWLGSVDRRSRIIEFEVTIEHIGAQLRANVWIHDSGPGIDPDDIELIFLPGVTRRPDGIGMGLNVAAELVAIYRGQMRALREPTKLGGASFCFDLPIAQESMGESR